MDCCAAVPLAASGPSYVSLRLPTVTLQSMESSMRPGGAGTPSSQLLRLLTSTADYALVLLRTLELMAGE